MRTVRLVPGEMVDSDGGARPILWNPYASVRLLRSRVSKNGPINLSHFDVEWNHPPRTMEDVAYAKSLGLEGKDSDSSTAVDRFGMLVMAAAEALQIDGSVPPWNPAWKSWCVEMEQWLLAYFEERCVRLVLMGYEIPPDGKEWGGPGL